MTDHLHPFFQFLPAKLREREPQSTGSEKRNANAQPPSIRLFLQAVYFAFFLIAACAAASLAIGTRNGEQET